MFRIAIIATIIAVAIPVLATVEDPDPTLDAPSATVRGKSVSVPVTNVSYQPITATVTALYDDLTEVHEAQTVVSLAAKQTAMVTVVFTITDDINPQVQITEGPDPIPFGIALDAIGN